MSTETETTAFPSPENGAPSNAGGLDHAEIEITPLVGPDDISGQDRRNDLASLEGMLWRALVLWFLANLLAAAIATF